MKIGIVGYGIIGGALVDWLTKNTRHDIKILDIPKGIQHSFDDVDAIFLCVPVPTLPSREQDISLIKESIMRFKNKDVPFFIRSTVLPGTADMIARLTGKTVVSMPEFLTERTANEDFYKHSLICGSPNGWDKNIVSQIFNTKKIFFMSNTEAEISKYAHNAFGAVKVNFFNIIYRLCKKHGAHYGNILEGVSVTGFIEKTHCQVPGPDGKYGYAGKCFPKDLRAFIGHLSKMMVERSSLIATEKENEIMRAEINA